MIGTSLNLPLPGTGESMTENIARIAAWLEAVNNSLAQKATPAALNINAPLELNGNSLTEVASVQFASGNVSSVAGSFYYYGGAWWLVDQVGAIQVTENGALKATGFGAITGDYGGSNPAAVTYVDANGQYVFTEDTGVYADLVADDLILQGTNGRVQLNVDDALTGDRNINIKTLPTSGVSMLVYNAATSTLEEGATTRATGTQLFTNVGISAPDVLHADVELPLSLIGAHSFAAGGNAVARPYDASRSTGSGTWTFSQHLPLKVGDRLKSVTIRLAKTVATLARIYIYKWDGTSLTEVAANTTSSSTTVEVTATVSSPTATVSGEHWFFQVEWSDGNKMDKLRMVYDRA